MRHGDITIDEALGVLDVLNGRPTVDAMLAGRDSDPAKFGRFTLGQIAEAVPNILGGEDVLQGLLAGDLKVERSGDVLLVKTAVKPLFDKNGRRIPPTGLVAAVTDANRNYRLDQPTIDYGQRLARFDGTGLVSFISGADFEARSNTLLAQLRESEQGAKLLNGVYLPVVIPQTEITKEKDYGKTAEEFVTAVDKAYRKQFPDRPFTNHRKGQLEGQTTIVAGSRHEQLVSKIGKTSVVGIYFPNCLQGFSVHAQREQMSSLPDGFLLSGVIDTAMGWVMYTDVLGRDGKTPLYDCSANQWQCAAYSLFFRAHDGDARFGSGGGLSHARDADSGGLLFVG